MVNPLPAQIPRIDPGAAATDPAVPSSPDYWLVHYGVSRGSLLEAVDAVRQSGVAHDTAMVLVRKLPPPEAGDPADLTDLR